MRELLSLQSFGRNMLLMPDEWLPLEEASKRLHVALDTMRRYIREGKFPYSKIGKRYLVQTSAIDDYIKSNVSQGVRPTIPRKPKEPESESQK
jgi:excisionase family DNA binding protein